MSLRKDDPYLGPTVSGIDVSAYQGWVDWPKVKTAGKEFAYCRLSEGVHLDHTFSRNYAASRAAGLVPGAYCFVRPALPIQAQVDVVRAVLEPLWRIGDLPVALDVERGADGTSASQIADRMLEWIAAIENAVGRMPVVYAGAFYAEAVHDARLGVFPLWTPWYNAAPCRIPRQWEHWTFWQNGIGRCPGISGQVDLDVFRGDRAAFDAFLAARG